MAGDYEAHRRIRDELAQGKVVFQESDVLYSGDDPTSTAFFARARIGPDELCLWSLCRGGKWSTDIFVARLGLVHPDTPSYPISTILSAGEAIRVVEAVRGRLQAGEALGEYCAKLRATARGAYGRGSRLVSFVGF